MLNIFLNGDPNSGKSTQAQLLKKKYNLREIDMGAELRKLMAAKPRSRAAKSLRATMDRGEPAPTAMVKSAYRKFITSAPRGSGLLFTSPYFVGEAQMIYRLLNASGRTPETVVVIYIKLPEREIVKRMKLRRERINGTIVQRADDNAVALRERIRIAKTDKQQVLHFFKTKYRTKVISGLGSRRQVAQRIQRAIKELSAKDLTTKS